MEPGEKSYARGNAHHLQGAVVPLPDAPESVYDEERRRKLREDEVGVGHERHSERESGPGQHRGHGKPSGLARQQIDISGKERAQENQEVSYKGHSAERESGQYQQGQSEAVLGVKLVVRAARLRLDPQHAASAHAGSRDELRGVRGERVRRAREPLEASRDGGVFNHESWVKLSLVALPVVVALVEVAVFQEANGGHQVKRLVTRLRA